jgi:phosphoribosyl 1,2-cyclic phosphodiesterase
MSDSNPITRPNAVASAMSVEFWGVRGSIPTPGPDTMRYGGNTSCVCLAFGTGQRLILDAGTGIRRLGQSLSDGDGDLFILVSHRHWDHIQGFPVFAPLSQAHRRIHVCPTATGHELFCSLIEQMDGAHFPITPDALPADWNCIARDESLFLAEHGIDVSRIAVNHPGGSSGFRIERNGASVVYIPDNELDPPGEPMIQPDELIDFCARADILIHDAQYVDLDMPAKRGWGHSVVGQVLEMAHAAEVRHLVLFHHDPDRSDDALDRIQEEARSWLSERGSATLCTVAHEGLVLELPGISAVVE